MKLAEIFVALPPHVAFLLENALEGAVLPENPTNEEVEVAAKLLVSFLKDEFPDERQETYQLLEQVPAAVLETLS